MQQSEVYARMTGIFRDVFDREVLLTEKTSAQNVDGWDSFAHINLTLAIESEFDVKFTTSDLEHMHSVGDLVAFVQQHSSPD